MAIYKPIKEFAFRLKDSNSVNDEDVRQILAEHFSQMPNCKSNLSGGGYIGASIEAGSPYNEQNQKSIDALNACQKFERFPDVEQTQRMVIGNYD